MAAPTTPRGSPKLGPAFSPKADKSDRADKAAEDEGEEAGPSSATTGASAAQAQATAAEGVRCPYCDEVLPPSLFSHSASTSAEEFDPAASEGLQKSVHGGDGAETLAAKAGITEADIKRWSELAGLELPRPPSPPPPQSAEQQAEAKPIPLLAPPPPSGKSSATSTAAKNKRFGFFSRKSEPGSDDSDDADLDDLVTGYAKVDEGPDDDEDTYEEKPIVFKKREEASTASAAAQSQSIDPAQQTSTTQPSTSANDATTTTSSTETVAPGASEPELRQLLKEVLGRITSLSKSHEELAASHSTLLTSLKIARSNLVMAEANTEMLESELRRYKASASTPSTVTATPAPRPSLEGSRLQSPPSGTPANKSFNFWARKASPLPSSPATTSSSAAPTKSAEDELARLREQVATQATQLDTLKQGKREIEAELEGLSQALFEEANKMVADERRRRAELEDNLREAREEREALRATIKVLGGSAPGTEANSDDEAERSSVGGDLNAHYAALRAGIDRVGARTPAPAGRVTKDNMGGAASPMPGAAASAASTTSAAGGGGGSTASSAGASPTETSAPGRTTEANGTASSAGNDGDSAGSVTPSRDNSPLPTTSDPSAAAADDTDTMPGAFSFGPNPTSPATSKEAAKGSAAMTMPPLPVPLETENPWG